jgi:Uma2 family endonuclease
MSAAVAATPTPVVPTPGPPGLPSLEMLTRLKRFTVDEYDTWVRTGAIAEDENIELIEGLLVKKMPHNPPHDGTVYATQDVLLPQLPSGWVCRVQMVFNVPDSRPEPDLVIARGDRRTYFTRHPGLADLGFVIEVADTSVNTDRADKLRVYARAGVPEYWIVNIPDRQIEVYTDPQPASNPPAFATRRTYAATDAVPVTLDGVTVGTVAVADVLP